MIIKVSQNNVLDVLQEVIIYYILAHVHVFVLQKIRKETLEIATRRR